MTAVLGCNSQASMEEICISLITHSVMIQAHSGIDSSRLVMAPASLIQSKNLGSTGWYIAKNNGASEDNKGCTKNTA